MQRITTVMAMLVGVLTLLGGCTAPGTSTELNVGPGEYAATFDAARGVLRDMWFDLERVDATSGVISTRPKHSAGLATLWDQEQSGADQEFDDLMHNQRRAVRITFEPTEEGVAGPPLDLRAEELPLTMRVRVTLWRDYRPGWQVQTSSVRLSTHAVDPDLVQRGMQPDYETAVEEDERLAARLTEEIRERREGK